MSNAGLDFVTWAQFTWVIGVQVTLIIAVGGVLLTAIRSKANDESVRRLWQHQNDDEKDLALFKVEVAQNHPTHQRLSDIEKHLKQHMDDKFNDIKDLIKEIKENINAS